MLAVAAFAWACGAGTPPPAHEASHVTRTAALTADACYGQAVAWIRDNPIAELAAKGHCEQQGSHALVTGPCCDKLAARRDRKMPAECQVDSSCIAATKDCRDKGGHLLPATCYEAIAAQ